MATTLTNSAEGVTPAGTAPTTGNSGGSSGSAFDSIGSPPAGGTLASDGTHAAHGSLSYEFATGATAGTCFVAWTTSMGTKGQAWFRLYVYFTANPGSIIKIFSALSGATTCGSIALTTGGLIRHLNTSGATIQTGTVAIALNQWNRIEGFITGSATVGQIEHKLFKSPDSTTPDETLTDAATQNTNSAMTVYRFGLLTSAANIGPSWIDDLGLSDTAYLGPALQAISGSDTGSGADTGSLTASLADTDTGSGADLATLTVSLAGADAAAGADTAALTVSPAAADTASGIDAGAVSAGVAGADTASSSDAASLAAALPGADIASGADTASMAAAISAGDASAGAGAASAAVAPAGADTVSGADSAILAALLAAADSAAAAELAAIAAALAAADTASGADAASVAIIAPRDPMQGRAALAGVLAGSAASAGLEGSAAVISSLSGG